MAKNNKHKMCAYCGQRAVYCYYDDLIDNLIYICNDCNITVSEVYDYEIVKFVQTFNGGLYKEGKENGQVWVFGF